MLLRLNPCSCGFYPDRSRCNCSKAQIRRYLGKISRPLLERFDLCLEVLPVSFRDLKKETKEECSKDIRKRVEAARKRQEERYEKTSFSCNSELSGGEVKKYCILTGQAKKRLEEAFEHLELSTRSYHRILKTARTIADLAGTEKVEEVHVAEALMYREPDRKYWGE